MRLDMHTRKKICAKIFKRYQKAGKKGKGEILNEYAKTLECNRDYLAHLLTNWGKTRYAAIGNKTVKLIAKEPVKGRQKATGGKKTGRPEKYHNAFVKILTEIWELFDFQCGKLLAPLIRGMIAFLVIEFKLGAELTTLLETVSPSTIDRKLKHEKKRLRIKGINTTKPGSLLKTQIPIRVYFSWDDRKPGFFELDTLAHCGTRNSGQFCWTLTITDVGSGWTEVCSLLNHAHRWVREQVEKTKENLPFPMLGVDSDNGDEFINKQLLEWCLQNQITFTRGRPYRKNDNCFVEQKNYDVVRKTVGYGRFEGEKAARALADVYRFLNPLLNYWYPTMQLIGKEKLSSGRYKKIYAKDPKPPYKRLLESQDISDECKEELRRRAASLNPIELKRKLDIARDRLLKLCVNEAYIPSTKVS
ncbi:MAG: transposase [Treponema sp.]|nr:transposase [Treponema sp.]